MVMVCERKLVLQADYFPATAFAFFSRASDFCGSFSFNFFSEMYVDSQRVSEFSENRF